MSSSLASNSYLSASPDSTGSSNYSRNKAAPRTPHRPQKRIDISSTDSKAEYDTLMERVRSWQLEKLRTPRRPAADTDSDSEEGCESDAEESEDDEEGGVSVFVRSDEDGDSEGYEGDDEGGEWDSEEGEETFVWVDSDGEEFYYRATVGGDDGEDGDVEEEEVREGSDMEEDGDEDEDMSGPEDGASTVAGDEPRTTVKPSIEFVGEEEALDEDSADERYRWRHTDRARVVAFRRQSMSGTRGHFEMMY